jgi:hypothetical protein
MVSANDQADMPTIEASQSPTPPRAVVASKREANAQPTDFPVIDPRLSASPTQAIVPQISSQFLNTQTSPSPSDPTQDPPRPPTEPTTSSISSLPASYHRTLHTYQLRQSQAQAFRYAQQEGERTIQAAFQDASDKSLPPPTVYICNLCELRFLKSEGCIEPDEQGRAYCEACIGGVAQSVVDVQKKVVAEEEQREQEMWKGMGLGSGPGQEVSGATEVGGEIYGGKGKGKAVEEEAMVVDGEPFEGGLVPNVGMEGRNASYRDGVALQDWYGGTANPAVQGQYPIVGGYTLRDNDGTAISDADPWARPDEDDDMGFDYDAYFADSGSPFG